MTGPFVTLNSASISLNVKKIRAGLWLVNNSNRDICHSGPFVIPHRCDMTNVPISHMARYASMRMREISGTNVMTTYITNGPLWQTDPLDREHHFTCYQHMYWCHFTVVWSTYSLYELHLLPTKRHPILDAWHNYQIACSELDLYQYNICFA
jgi:hypothetical protein